MDVLRAADGILRIAVTTMSHAVKAVTTERGLDVGGFVMAVYGGAGPLHASAIAREIGIRRVLIPYSPGYFSAYGMLFSDLRYDYVRSCFRRLATVDFKELEAYTPRWRARARPPSRDLRSGPRASSWSAPRTCVTLGRNTP
jgi:N-methylhydantoinase A